MNWDDKIIRIPVGKVFCYYCDVDYGSKQLRYLPVKGMRGNYKAPFCPGCTSEISFERLKIDAKYTRSALARSAQLFAATGKKTADHLMRFITIYSEGGVSGCSAVWPRDMKTELKSQQLDSYVSKAFKLDHYSRTSIPMEFSNDVPFKFVYVEISENIKRIPIADLRLN